MAGRKRISLLSCASALAIAGCGSGDGTIPQDKSDQLLNLLTATEGAITEGECERAQGFAQEFIAEVGDLPPEVDPEVAEELTTAAGNLDQLAGEPGECTETGASGATGETTTTTEETTTEEPETTTTTTEETTTDETTTEEPEEEEPEEEPEPTPEPQPEPEPQPGGGGGASDGGLEPPSGGVEPGGGSG
jgi:hypothetical protein